MRLSRYSQTPVAPRDFWTCVLVATLVLGGLGIYSMQSANGFHFPHLPLLWAGLLLCLWLVFLAGIAKQWRMGRLARDSWQSVAALFVYTLFISDKLAPHPAQWLHWTSNVGALLMGILMILPYVDFSKRPRGGAAAHAPDGL
jgi:hypothetical protein